MGSATLGVGFTDELDGVLVGTDEGDTTGEAEAGGTGVDEVPGSAGFDVQATSATRAVTTAAMRVVFGTFPRSVRPRKGITEPFLNLRRDRVTIPITTPQEKSEGPDCG